MLAGPVRLTISDMHDELRQLAHESSSEKRLELLRKLSDLYFHEPGSRSDAEDYLFGEIVEKILDAITGSQKVVVSETIGAQPGFPRMVALKLAADSDAAVARPVLTNSATLHDGDLVQLAGSGSQEHLRAIAERTRLSEVITDVLIDRGDRQVVHAVSSNAGATFSDAGMDELLIRARDDVDLRELLVDRPDLSQASVDKLLPLVSADVAVGLAERGFELGGSLPPDMLALVTERLASALRQRKGQIRDTANLVQAVQANELALDEAVCLLAHAGRLIDLSKLLSAFAGVDSDYLFSLLSRGQRQALMILFRALGLSWTSLDRVLALRDQKQAIDAAARSDLRADYERINPAAARRTLRFSHVRRAAAS